MKYVRLQIQRNPTTGELKYTETPIDGDRVERKNNKESLLVLPGSYSICSPDFLVSEYKPLLFKAYLHDAEAALEQAHKDYENALSLKLSIINGLGD